jgi:formylglycine-generating enzyme required for sulfatase activity
MVEVEAGPFLMGCTDGGSWLFGCADDELPVQSLDLPAFEIDRTEVSQKQYAACVDAGVCRRPPPAEACGWDPEARGASPVVCVSWFDARDFCAFTGKRLPTEAEWEKAARGTDGRKFPWGDEVPYLDPEYVPDLECRCLKWNDPRPDCDRAVFEGCAVGPAGERRRGASPYGALDMAGNVQEWVEDWYDPEAYRRASAIGPAKPIHRFPYRVTRGGNFDASLYVMRTATRGRFDPFDHAEWLGFRCARSLP